MTIPRVPRLWPDLPPERASERERKQEGKRTSEESASNRVSLGGHVLDPDAFSRIRLAIEIAIRDEPANEPRLRRTSGMPIRELDRAPRRVHQV